MIFFWICVVVFGPIKCGLNLILPARAAQEEKIDDNDYLRPVKKVKVKVSFVHIPFHRSRAISRHIHAFNLFFFFPYTTTKTN